MISSHKIYAQEGDGQAGTESLFNFGFGFIFWITTDSFFIKAGIWLIQLERFVLVLDSLNIIPFFLDITGWKSVCPEMIFIPGKDFLKNPNGSSLLIMTWIF